MQRYGLKAFLSICLAAGFAIGGGGDADAQKRIRWKMHSSFGSNLSILGTGGHRLAERVKQMSDGAFELQFFEPGALVPALQYIDAVSAGSIDAAWGSAGYNVNKEPALAFFSSVPFGPRAGEYLAWMRFGGGYALYDEIYAQFNIKGLECGLLAPEASGWFRNEIKSVDDLKGLKMRFFGLGARTVERFGVSTQLLAGGDIYPALELGTIDATEFSMPSLDESLGFFQIAKHYYFPGWHQQATLLDLTMNLEKYNALSDQNKVLLDAACGDSIHYTLAEGEALQFGAMKRMQEKGVILHRWPDDMLAKFEAAWQQVAADESAKSPVFKKVYDSYAAFRANYAIWRDMGYLD